MLRRASVSWVAKFKGDKNSECKLSNGRSRSYKVINLVLSAGKWAVAKLQGAKSAAQSCIHGTLLPLDFWTPPRFLNVVCTLLKQWLSGWHQTTHIASNLSSRALALQAMQSAARVWIAGTSHRSRLKCTPSFRITSQHRRIFAGAFVTFFLRLQSKVRGLCPIARDLGVCDSNRIAHRGGASRDSGLEVQWFQGFLLFLAGLRDYFRNYPPEIDPFNKGARRFFGDSQTLRAKGN